MSNLIIPSTLSDVTDFEEWLEKYELISKANEWDEEAQVNNIGIFLADIPLERLRSLCDEEKEDYSTLKSALRARIYDKYVQEMAKTEFNSYQQRFDENNFQNVGLFLRKKCRVAYPDLDPKIQDMLCRDRLVEAISNNDVRIWVRNFRPKTLDESVLLATVFHMNFEKEAELKKSSEKEDGQWEIQKLREEIQSLRSEIRGLGAGKVKSLKKSAAVCWCCGSFDHVLQNCGAKKIGLLHVDGFLGLNKVGAQIVVDTGANISLIRKDLWMKTGCSLMKIDVENYSVVGLNGDEVEFVGKSCLPVYLHGFVCKFDFVVVPNLVADCIIGVDFMKVVKCDINLSRNVLKIGGNDIKMKSGSVIKVKKEESAEDFEIGQLVFMCNASETEGPYIIKAKLQDSSFRIQNAFDGKRIRLVVKNNQITKANV